MYSVMKLILFMLYVLFSRDMFMWWLFSWYNLIFLAIEMIDDEKVESSMELNIPGELGHFLNPIYSFKHVDDEDWFYKF